MERKGDPGRELIGKSWRAFGFTFAGCGLVLLIITIQMWPAIDAFTVERFFLPQYESILGFRGGRVSLRTAGESYSMYALIEVEPGGVLSRAGARAGDVPFAPHGGVWSFYHAVRRVTSGEEARFEVIRRSNWWSGKRRTIVLTPANVTGARR